MAFVERVTLVEFCQEASALELLDVGDGAAPVRPLHAACPTVASPTRCGPVAAAGHSTAHSCSCCLDCTTAPRPCAGDDSATVGATVSATVGGEPQCRRRMTPTQRLAVRWMFTALKAHCRVCRQRRAVCVRLCMRRAWRQWRWVAADGAAHTAAVATCWAQWRGWVLAASRRRRVCGEVVAAWRAVAVWAAARRAAAARRLAAVADHTTARTVFLAWRCAVHAATVLRQAALQAAQRRTQRRCLAQCWRHWKILCTMQRSERRCRLLRVWGFRALAAHVQRAREFKIWRMDAQRRVLVAWRSRTTSRRRRRHVLAVAARAGRALALRVVARPALRRWQQAASTARRWRRARVAEASRRRRRHQRLQRAAVAQWRLAAASRQCCRAALTAWRRRAVAQRTLKLVLVQWHKAAAAQRTAARVLLHWHQTATARRQSRSALLHWRQTVVVDRHCAARALQQAHRVFRAWQSAARLQAERRKTLALCDVYHAHVRGRQLLRRWRRRAGTRRRPLAELLPVKQPPGGNNTLCMPAVDRAKGHTGGTL